MSVCICLCVYVRYVCMVCMWWCVCAYVYAFSLISKFLRTDRYYLLLHNSAEWPDYYVRGRLSITYPYLALGARTDRIWTR